MRPGRTPLQVWKEHNTAETLISESSAQTDRVYCPKYPICVTLLLNQTIQTCLVQIRFQLQNESIAFEPKESVVWSLHCFHICQAVAEEWRWSKQTRGFLWPKQGCSLGEREVYIKPGTDKTTMRVFNQSSKVYQSRTEKKRCKKKKKPIMSLPEGVLFFPLATTPFCFVLCTKHSWTIIWEESFMQCVVIYLQNI